MYRRTKHNSLDDDEISLSTFRRLSSISAFKAQILASSALPQLTIWEQILAEYDEKRLEYFKNKEASKLPVLVPNEHVEYIRKEVLPHLYIALEDTLIKAKQWDCLQWQKCYFNGIDNIVEVLWNRNPKFPERMDDWKKKFDIPWVIEMLKQNPRPIYPLSWLWGPEYAALIIQKCYRAYKDIRDRDDVLELRKFWKDLAQDTCKDEDIRSTKEKEEKAMMLSDKKAREIARAELMQFIEMARKAREAARISKAQAELDLKNSKKMEMGYILTERQDRREKFAAAKEIREERAALVESAKQKKIKEAELLYVSSDLTTCGSYFQVKPMGH